jgi:hypothetical protein
VVEDACLHSPTATQSNFTSKSVSKRIILQRQSRTAAEASSPSGFHCVHASGKRWRAQVSYGGKKHSLGSFDTKQEAALTYDRAARQCGEDTPLNYDSSKAAEEAAAYRPQVDSRLPAGGPQERRGGVVS